MKVNEDMEVMIITAQGKVIRLEASKIREAGRSTQGVKLIDREIDDKVAAASMLRSQTEIGEDGSPPVD
jgi:DNA gyrase subunit A